jgi:RNAse (barnase) inhibitor barstar
MSVPSSSVPVLSLDCRGWSSVSVAYSALLSALGAPSWHGRNLDALNDSLVAGGINQQKAPFRIEVSGSRKKLPGQVQTFLIQLEKILARAREEGKDITLVFVPGDGQQAKAAAE